MDLQPDAPSKPVQAAIAAWQYQPGPLLPLLHAVQESLGYIPREAINTIAAALKLTRAEVSGVISFYHHFRTTPPGRHRVEVCRAEACQAVGARQLEAHAKTRLGLDYHQTGTDGQFSLEPVYCLGNCACGPSIRIGDAVHGRVSEARFDELLAGLNAQVLEVQG
ncbi:MAG TPA: formate dehydrogenase subunit gamma [Halieaceae bacterium]|jgi:formate dehydrogenase subunit gamma|nr:formate dehydrogenase subunit gamma [Halieaceae bacterium]|tara:strand:+ start:68 stop:562 length:495 start_codon:yes stop_codon:yes gene_type:complete